MLGGVCALLPCWGDGAPPPELPVVVLSPALEGIDPHAEAEQAGAAAGQGATRQAIASPDVKSSREHEFHASFWVRTSGHWLRS